MKRFQIDDAIEPLLDRDGAAPILGATPRQLENPAFRDSIGLKEIRVGKFRRYEPRNVREARTRLLASAGIAPSQSEG